MRSQAVASGTAPDATEPCAVEIEDLSHLPSYARPTRASLGHVRKGVRASTGSLPATHRPFSAAKPQQHVRAAAAGATTDAAMRRGSSRCSTAGDTCHALESIHEVPAAAAAAAAAKAPEAVPPKRSVLSGTVAKTAAVTNTSRHSIADSAAHRDLSSTHGDQSVRSSMSGRDRPSLPGSKYPSRSTASTSTGSRPAPAAGSRPLSSRAAPMSAPGSRPSSAASGQAVSSTSTSSSSGGGSRAVSAPARRTNSRVVAETGPTGGAAKGRKSITPRAAQSAAVTSTDIAGKGRSAAQPLSKSARCVSTATSADAYLAAPLTAGASAGGAFKGRKVSVGSAAVSSAGAGAAARTNRASMVRASRDSTSSGLQAGAGAAQVARPAKPSPLPTASTSAAAAATSAATTAQGAAAAVVGTEALERVAEADALCAAVAAAAKSQSLRTAATTAEPARIATAAQRSITPDALVPAPGFGTLITPSAIGPTPYGPTPMPPTAFKQGWRPGATPEATPGGLMGHFTALVTPGGACWPQGMPAGGLVPYSITPPEGGRTIARTGAGGRGIGGHTPAAMGTGAAGAGTAAAGAAGRLEQGFAAASESPRDSRAAASEGPREGLRTQSARPYRSVTPPTATAAVAGVGGRSSSVRRSMTPTEEGAVIGAEGPDSSRRSQTPGRTPHSAAKNAALAAQLQNLEQTWGQYKETSGRSSISCSPARARSVPRGSSMRSSIGMPGTRSSLSYSPADTAAPSAAAAPPAGTDRGAAMLVAAVAESPAGKGAGHVTKQLPQLPDVGLMQGLKAAAAAAEAAWYASKSGEEEAQGQFTACEQTDGPAAAAGGSSSAGVSKAPAETPGAQTAAGAGSNGAQLSVSKGTVTGSTRPHRYSSGSNATPQSTARPVTVGSARPPGKTPTAAAGARAVNTARLTGTKRQTPSRPAAAPGAARTPASAAAATPAAHGGAATAAAAAAAAAEGMASGAKWSATAQWAAPSPSASPSFTVKKTSKHTGKTPLRHGSAARAAKSSPGTAGAGAAAANGRHSAGSAVPFSGFGCAAAVGEGSPTAASAGAQAGHVVAQFGTPTFGGLTAAAGVPDSPSNIDVSGDIEEVAERLADFSMQQYALQQQQQRRVTSPDAAVGGTGVKPPLEGSRQGLKPGPSAVQASWMAFAAGAPGSTSSAGRVKTPPRFRLSGVGVAAGLDGSGSSHGSDTAGAPMGGVTQAVTPQSATAAAAGSSGGSKVQRSIPKAPVVVATTVTAAADAGSSHGGSGATTPTGSESEFYSPLQCTPGSSKSQSHASRLAAEEAATSAAEPSSVEKLSRKYAALSLIPKAPGTAGAAAVPVPGPGDAFFTPVEGLVQGAASPGFSSARRQGVATATAAAAAAGDDVAVSSASKRRRVAAAAAAAVAAAFGGTQADAEAAAAAAAAVVATAHASGQSVGAAKGAASQPAKVSKQLLDLFDTAAAEASVTPPSVAAAAAAAAKTVSRGASSTPGSTGSVRTGSAPRPMCRLSSGAMRTPIVPLSGSPATATAAPAPAAAGASKTHGVSASAVAPAGVVTSSKTPVAAGAGKLPAATAVPAAGHAALGARAAFFDVPEVGTPLFPPHTPAATPLKTGFGALSARKLAHIGSGARRVTTAAPTSRRKQQQWEVQEAETAQAPAPAAAVSGAAAAAAAAAALHSRIGKGPAAVQSDTAVTPSADAAQPAGAGGYSIPASARRPITRRYAAALTPPAAAPAAAAAEAPTAEAPADAASAVARHNKAGAAAAAAAAGGQPGSGPDGLTDTLAAAAAAAAAGFDVGFRPSPTFKVQSKFPAPATTPPAGATGTVPAAAGTPYSAGFGSSGIGSPSFATTESDTASTEQGKWGAGHSALKSTAKSGRSANKMFSGGLTKARQLLKAALPKGSSSKASAKHAAATGEASTPAAAAAAVTAAGGVGGEAQGAWEVTDTYALSQQQSFDDARGPGYDDQTRDMPSSGPFRSAGVSKGQVPASAAAAAAAGGPGRVRSPPEGAGAGGMLGAWDAADMALPIEAMSDTAYVTTRRRH